MSHQSVATTSFQPLASAPQWFTKNLQQPGTSLYITANNKRVHCQTWNWQQQDLPPLILVHGFSGHAYWWSFLAPFFCDRYRIAAIDLPGMGDSDSLDEYNDECFSNAVLALIEQQQLQAVSIIGHSFGGVTTLHSLLRNEPLFKQAIVVDSYIRLSTEETVPILTPKGFHHNRDSREACMQRFRLSPDQPLALDYLMHYVGYHSCKETADGWQWKFDPKLRNFGELNEPEHLGKLSTPVTLIYGESSMFSTDGRPQYVHNCLGNTDELIMIPNAHHHIMMDHPLELVAAINRCLDKV